MHDARIISLYGTPSTFGRSDELSGLKEAFDRHAIVAFRNPRDNEISAFLVPNGIRGIFDPSNVELQALREFMYSDVPKTALTLNSARYLNIPEMSMPMRKLRLPTDNLDTRFLFDQEKQQYPIILFVNKDSVRSGNDWLGHLTRLGDFSFSNGDVKIVNDFSIPLNDRENVKAVFGGKFINPIVGEKDLVTKYINPTLGEKDLVAKFIYPTLGEKDLVTKYINPTLGEKDLVAKYINPIVGEKDLVAKYINPTFVEKDILRKYVNPIYGERDIMTKYANPAIVEKDILRKYVNPIYGERDIMTKYINPTFDEKDIMTKYINPIYGEKDIMQVRKTQSTARETWLPSTSTQCTARKTLWLSTSTPSTARGTCAASTSSPSTARRTWFASSCSSLMRDFLRRKVRL
ncbi:uncharacterized protein LOC117650797 [Thrips palmi]|uniref:Uncharacterized protein LOC117650797 n=1 Tax=Thrips palmi TaxID=161013 RepID=A0A6P8ZYT1_THRPL|nr:uncharacterized protein LOC117650797 [Thrips palmi]